MTSIIPTEQGGGCPLPESRCLMLESLLKIVVDVVAELAHITFRVWFEQDWRRKLVALLLFLLLSIVGFWYVCLCAR